MKVIEVKSLSKSFGKLVALKNLNLSVEKGSIFGIIGQSGAGKSTLIRCLSGLEKPDKGDIVIADETPILARKKTGMIFQHFNLFEFRSALENVMYPLEIIGVNKEDAKRKALDLLKLVHLKGKENCYPATLSGGEKQRVGIARALARDPLILFSDEATSALDPPTKNSILELLLELNRERGLTIFLITHEMEVIKKICTDVAVLEDGCIAECGKVEDLFTSPDAAMTQKFLRLPDHLFSCGPDEELLWLFFKGSGTKEPIISKLAKHFDVESNILLGDIDMLRTTMVGRLLLSLKGPKEARVRACRFLKEQGVCIKR